MDTAVRRPLFSGWLSFWFTPVNPVALHRLRVVAGLLFLCWLLPLAGHVEDFFGSAGWFDATASAEARQMREGSPEPSWSVLALVRGNPALLNATYWMTIIVFLAFTLGICARLTAVLSWLMVVSFLATPAASYDADFLVALIAFYMMIGYVLLGQWSRELSPAERILGPRDVGLLAWLLGAKSDAEPAPSFGANLAVRLLQIHFAFVVVISGLHKLQFGDWWSGVAFWYPLHPPFETTPETIDQEAAAGSIYSRLFVMSLCEYLVLAWQIGFPLFAWRKGWRIVLIGGALIGWLGCAFLYKLPYFGPIYLIGCLSYLTPEEWLSLGRWTARLRTGAPAATERKPRYQPRVPKHA